ncbi:pyridoxal phosphate-dependent aminotransferase (plasmid) [Haloferax gibbonsii]|uniref:Pyridoxal phosphate-dependent aminotransferase n=1 Tax=Haloferax gibbonsii TaxID=35746 RepID=A0A871BLU7_HALGI|nr:aminotransferase class IV [Haloferax gibbonsii]QOS14091.1 pyridoxal phosphate-dependent aminotransferase [Haloferax gibbonsii]
MANYLSQTPETIAESYININGELVPGDEAHVSVLDRNFLYGDGVFDGMPVYEGKVVLGERHIDRFFRSTAAVKIDMPISKDELRERMMTTLEKSNLENGACRLIASRGLGPSGVKNTRYLGEPTIVVIPQHTEKDDVAYGRGEAPAEKARIASTRMLPADTIDPRIKSCNYLVNALAERELIGTDADFAIMLDQDGYVSEAFDANIFVEDHNGTIKTPESLQALGGITREVTIELARDLGYDVEETKLTTYDLFTANEVFMTSSGRGVASIAEIDGRPVGTGAKSETVQDIALALYEYIQENEYLELNP